MVRTVTLARLLSASATIAANRTRFTPGFHGRVGMQIRVAPQADLKLDFGAGYSFKGQFFLKNRSWLEPSISFTNSFPAGYENRTSIKGD